MVMECRSCVIVLIIVNMTVAVMEFGDNQLVGALGEELSDAGHQLLP
jgi:hypothetical protein